MRIRLSRVFCKDGATECLAGSLWSRSDGEGGASWASVEPLYRYVQKHGYACSTAAC